MSCPSVPWEFHPELLYKGRAWWEILLYVILATLAGSFVGFIVAMRYSKKFNKKIRESRLFRQSTFAHNSVVRKSLALPPLGSISELQALYDEAVDGPSQEHERSKRKIVQYNSTES